MHPFVETRQRLALFLIVAVALGWLLAGLMWGTTAMSFRTSLAVMAPLGVAFAIISLSALWVGRQLPLDRPLGRLLSGWLAAALQASAVWVAFAAMWSAVLRRSALLPATRNEVFTGLGVLFAIGIPLYLVSLVVHYLVLTFEASRAAERRVLSTEVTAREAEVRALRAQLNPHFLFNSLNSINALVGVDPEGARRMCESLGDFLRRSLSLGSRDAVTLEEELSLVDRYFEIERVRFGDRLRAERYVEAGAERCLVPPLLLQPLVENAIKHGIADRLEGGRVRVAAMVVDGFLRVTVENDVDDDAPSRAGGGVGLENVRRRLDALSARETRLDTHREDGRFRVSLTLPARRAPEAAHA